MLRERNWPPHPKNGGQPEITYAGGDYAVNDISSATPCPDGTFDMWLAQGSAGPELAEAVAMDSSFPAGADLATVLRYLRGRQADPTWFVAFSAAWDAYVWQP